MSHYGNDFMSFSHMKNGIANVNICKYVICDHDFSVVKKGLTRRMLIVSAYRPRLIVIVPLLCTSVMVKGPFVGRSNLGRSLRN
jgi:hypothetical protein